ncbi:MAG: MATE family efflux transporter [Kosmotogaceae bacterium]
MTDFTRRILNIAIPITIQNFISVGLNLVDNIMIGQLGAVSIASVGIVNQVVFILMLVTFGAASGSGVFVSQYWGIRDSANIEKTVGHILKITVAAAVIFFVLLFVFPERLLSLFTNDLAVIELGAEYSKVVSFTTFFTSFSFIMAMVLRTVEKAKIPMYISLVALAVNTLSNYLLIFGIGFFPELGVKGAAIATLMSRTIEFLLYMYALRKDWTPIKINIKSLFSFDAIFFKRLMKIASPVIANEFLWSLGITMYSVVLARMSTEAIAVRNIEHTIGSFGFIFFGGISAATVVLVGSELGKNNYENAIKNAHALLKITLVLAVISGLGIIALSWGIIDFYNVSEDIKTTLLTVMIIMGLSQPLRMVNNVNLVGVLRSGGDTKIVLFLEIFSLWAIGIPLVAISGLALKWTIPLVYLMMLPEQGFKGIFGFLRLKSGKWARNVIE